MRKICLLLGLVGCGPGLRAESFAANSAYRLGPGDAIEVAVFEVEELSKPAVLAPDGTATLPLVGVVKLSGLTAQQAAARLRELYANNLIRDPQISVSVKEYHSQPVSVLGAVVKPGVYQLRGPRRLSDVLALAEGLLPEAGNEITIRRTATAETLRVATRGSAEDNPWIEGGDAIHVSKAGVVYVVGEVGRAGGFPLKDQEQITVLKALS